MNTGKKLAIICLNKRAKNLARKIISLGFEGEIYSKANPDWEGEGPGYERPLINGKVKETLAYCFKNYDSIICIMAAGIVVRSLDGLLDSKFKDPALIVMDENGKFAVSLLSGHFGGANRLAQDLAEALGGQAVITTSTDSKGLVGLDSLAIENGLYYRDLSENTLFFNSLLANEKKLGLYNEAKINLSDISGYLEIESLDGLAERDLDGLVIISQRKKSYQDLGLRTVKLVKKSYDLGIGCRKNIPYQNVKDALDAYTDQLCIDPLAIRTIASIDLKKDEPAIKELAKNLGAVFISYGKEELLPYEKYYKGSEFVKKTVGVSSVSMAAAHKASGNRPLSQRFKSGGVTLALSEID